MAESVSYESGSYRDSLVLHYTENSLSLSRVLGGKETVLCTSTISNETLEHSKNFFEEIGVKDWDSTYFSEHTKDGNTFSLKVQIGGFSASNQGHYSHAPKGLAKVERYLNQLLVVNGCTERI
jgi:hypothetical protein